MQRSDPGTAGSYANQGRYVETDTGRHHFSSPGEVPALMGDYAQWLAAAPATPETAFAAHHRLVEIHPFNDGNGRTARLVMTSFSCVAAIRRLPCGRKIARLIFLPCRTRRPDAAAPPLTACFTSDWTQRWGSP
jgi:hypothetical protein